MGSGVGGGQERESQRALATFEVKSPLVGTPSWVEPDSCFQLLSTDEDVAFTLPYGRGRLFLVE
jgi:hypothetical protein